MHTTLKNVELLKHF